MKTLVKAAIGLMCLVSVAQADVIAPDALITTTVNDVLTLIKQDKDLQSGNQKKILELVDAKVLPHFDFTRMTQQAVGKNWKTATPEQKQALTTEFRNLLVRTYTNAFTQYKDQKVDVKPVKMVADATDVVVKTTISRPGGTPTQVNYEMEKKTDAWKAIDVIIEGASLVQTYRGSFTTEIQEKGIDSLIKTLKDKNAALASGTAKVANK